MSTTATPSETPRTPPTTPVGQPSRHAAPLAGQDIDPGAVGDSPRRPIGRQKLVAVAAGVTVVLWASAFIGIRAAGHDFSPGALTLGRIAVGTVALTIMVACTGKFRRNPATAPGPGRLPRGKILAGVLVWGVLWFGTYNIVLNAAERTLDAGTASMLVQLAPILVAVAAGLMLGEGFPARLLAGIGVAFIGVAAIAWASSSGASEFTAVLLGIAAAVLYATGTVVQKRLLPHVDALTMTWLGCLAGTVATLPFAGTLIVEIAAAPVAATLGVAYLGVFPTAIAFATWGYALSHTTAGRLSATTYVVPPLAVLMSWWLLGEAPAFIALVGGALCIGGVILATWKPARRTARTR